jgi:prevent-host-death family protein
MPAIIPIKDLKNTSEISDLCHRTDGPIYVTKNGYGDLVIMSMESYENALRREKLYADLELSEQQASRGETLDARQALNEMRERYGL